MDHVRIFIILGYHNYTIYYISIIHAGSFRPFVAVSYCQPSCSAHVWAGPCTFKVEKDIGLIVLEHLSDEFRVHVLDVDLLEVLVKHHDGLVQFLLHVVSAPVLSLSRIAGYY